jgi:hypothetical protein
MGRSIFRLMPTSRAYIAQFIASLPDGWFVECAPPRRSLAQNARMWAMLQDVADQKEWYGKKLSAEEWKTVFTASLKKAKVVPGLDGEFVVLGYATSKMTIGEMADLMTLIEAFSAKENIKLKVFDEI